jgi:hypothetical protein
MDLEEFNKIGIPSLYNLIAASWHNNPEKRPDFPTIVRELEAALQGVTGTTLAADIPFEEDHAKLHRRLTMKQINLAFKQRAEMESKENDAPIQELSISDVGSIASSVKEDQQSRDISFGRASSTSTLGPISGISSTSGNTASSRIGDVEIAQLRDLMKEMLGPKQTDSNVQVMEITIKSFKGKSRKVKVDNMVTFDELLAANLPTGYTKNQLSFYDENNVEWTRGLTVCPTLKATGQNTIYLGLKEDDW